MIEHGIAKITAAKVFGIALYPGPTLLIFGGAVLWGYLKNKKNIQKLRTDLDEGFDRSNAESNTLSRYIDQLKEDISALPSKLERTHPGLYFNEHAQPTKDSTKKDLLKWIIDDNVKLRESF